jgi:hypothetical protein
VKRLKIISCKGVGIVNVDEKGIIINTPSFWNRFLNQGLEVLQEELSKYDKIVIKYMLDRGNRYVFNKYSDRPNRIKEKHRLGENQSGQIGRAEPRTLTPIKEKPRIILHRRNK